MDEFIFYDGKKLRKGYTTGSCATAAATAGILALLTEEALEMVSIETPNGQTLEIPIASCQYQGNQTIISSVIKDGGDDIDATDGMEIFAKVTLNQTGEITIDGGEGIGRVTQEGLLEPVGAAAINPVPRKMITASVRKALGQKLGADILIFAPEGEKIAKRTMNGRLGIVGGISILGTTGIVTPMSEAGWKSSISIELEMKRKQGYEAIVLTPGNYGEKFAVEEMAISKDKIVSMSNFVGYVLKEVQRLGFKKILIVGHLGKLIKVSAGIFATHSQDADARNEILVANLALLGMQQTDLTKIDACLTTDAAGDIIEELGYCAVYQQIADKIQARAVKYLKYKETIPNIEVVVFSSKRGFLASSKPLAELKEEWQ